MLVDTVETNAADACASRQKAQCGARCDVHVHREHHGQRLLCEAGGVSVVDISAGISLDDIFVEFVSWCDIEWGFSDLLVELCAHMACVDGLLK